MQYSDEYLGGGGYLNEYIYVEPFQLGDRLYTSVYRRQILVLKEDPCTDSNKICIMAVDP